MTLTDMRKVLLWTHLGLLAVAGLVGYSYCSALDTSRMAEDKREIALDAYMVNTNTAITTNMVYPSIEQPATNVLTLCRYSIRLWPAPPSAHLPMRLEKFPIRATVIILILKILIEWHLFPKRRG